MTTANKAWNLIAAVLVKLLARKLGYDRLLELVRELQQRTDDNPPKPAP